jgi:hypothetical protein
MDQALTKRPFRIEAPGRQQHFQSSRFTDQARQTLRAAPAGNDPE